MIELITNLNSKNANINKGVGIMNIYGVYHGKIIEYDNIYKIQCSFEIVEKISNKYPLIF